MNDILDCFKKSAIKITSLLRNHDCFELGEEIENKNSSGDSVKKLDEMANDTIKEELLHCPAVFCMASEEEEKQVYTMIPDSKYFVTFDPLDGSSNIELNTSIGTIFCVFEYRNHQISSGRNIVMAGYVVYGFQTILVVSSEDGGLDLYKLNEDQVFMKIKKEYKMPLEGNLYAINESNKYRWKNGKITNLVDRMIDCKKTLRWNGCLVSDAHRTLMKGGMFAYPLDSKSPNGRLRLLYEAYPMAYLFHCAGGYSSNEQIDILDIPFPVDVADIHVRTSLLLLGESEFSCL
tara:strand:- start:298 stop:1170 length:873 start_codon:yes stop_codon:yes gene_type:complete